MPSDTAVKFFHEHAGWGYRPAEETPEEGRMRGARDLARGEAHLAERIEAGTARVVWEDDPDVDLSWADDETRAKVDSGEWAYESCRIEGCCDKCGSWSTLASLGGIVGADDNYRRVVAAELAWEYLMHEAVSA